MILDVLLKQFGALPGREKRIQAYNRLWSEVVSSKVGSEADRNGTSRTFWDNDQRKHRVTVSSFEEMRPVGEGNPTMARRRVLQVRELVASARDGSLELRVDSFVVTDEATARGMVDRLLERGFENAPTTYRTRYQRDASGIKECELHRPAVRRSPAALRRELEASTRRARFAVIRTVVAK
ncbi:MAG: hypothetical protein AMXMBFR33_39840 [Candidatus Xenobia bacterium]